MYFIYGFIDFFIIQIRFLLFPSPTKSVNNTTPHRLIRYTHIPKVSEPLLGTTQYETTLALQLMISLPTWTSLLGQMALLLDLALSLSLPVTHLQRDEDVESNSALFV